MDMCSLWTTSIRTYYVLRIFATRFSLYSQEPSIWSVTLTLTLYQALNNWKISSLSKNVLIMAPKLKFLNGMSNLIRKAVLSSRLYILFGKDIF